jgi:hypothetical protein
LNTEAQTSAATSKDDIVNCFLGLVSDPHRYFDDHQAGSDTFDKVSSCELEMSATAMAALIYLVDK